MHLFLSVHSAQTVGSLSPIFWNLQQQQPLDMVVEAPNVFGNHIFREIIITACWIIWTTTNRVTFDNANLSLNLCKEDFKKELGLVCIKAK
jgi:hypothetical protein